MFITSFFIRWSHWHCSQTLFLEHVTAIREITQLATRSNNLSLLWLWLKRTASMKAIVLPIFKLLHWFWTSISFFLGFIPAVNISIKRLWKEVTHFEKSNEKSRALRHPCSTTRNVFLDISNARSVFIDISKAFLTGFGMIVLSINFVGVVFQEAYSYLPEIVLKIASSSQFWMVKHQHGVKLLLASIRALY